MSKCGNTYLRLFFYFFFPFHTTSFSCLLKKQIEWPTHRYYLFFDPGCIFFHTIVISCLLLSGDNAILPVRERVFIYFFLSLPPCLPGYSCEESMWLKLYWWLKLLWSSWSRPTINLICLTWRQMSPFVCDNTNSSLNALTLVACVLQDAQRTECRLTVKSSWDFILLPLFRWGMVLENHSIFLGISIYKQGRLGELANVCKVLF